MLGLESVEERRSGLMKEFAIKAYTSPEHKWWFRPHPPAPCNTRLILPRFHVPAGKSARFDKRPIIHYTRILNSMSEEEWENRGLDPVVSTNYLPNIQLSQLGPVVSKPDLGNNDDVFPLCLVVVRVMLYMVSLEMLFML